MPGLATEVRSDRRDDSPLVSVIIPTHNSASTLKDTLNSLRAQEFLDMEVIVCDRASTDATLSIAQQAGVRIIRGGTERSSQVNRAAAAARGKYLYYAASDFTFEPGLLRAAVHACEEEGFDAVAVPVRGAGDMFWQRVKTLERECYRGDDLIVGVRFFSRSAFDAVGGYAQDLVAGEDYDIHNRLVSAGYRWREILNSEIHWGEPRSLREIALKSFYYGRTMGRYVRRHPGRGMRQINPMRGAFLRNWRLLLRHPGLTAGLVILKFVQYSAGAAGLLAPLSAKQLSETTDPEVVRDRRLD